MELGTGTLGNWERERERIGTWNVRELGTGTWNGNALLERGERNFGT